MGYGGEISLDCHPCLPRTHCGSRPLRDGACPCMPRTRGHTPKPRASENDGGKSLEGGLCTQRWTYIAGKPLPEENRQGAAAFDSHSVSDDTGVFGGNRHCVREA